MSMLLRGDNDREFELGLVQDHFAEQQDGFGDSGFVTLGFRVATPEDSWEETAPILNVYELSTLLEWLEAVAEGSPDISEVELLEPALKFSVLRNGGERITIRVDFHLEDRPPIFALDAPTDRQHVDLRISRDQVRMAAAELKRDLDAVLHPPRGDEVAGDWGIFGQPDPDLNLLSDDDASEFPELADDHDDLREIDEAELREMGFAGDEEDR
jgi:hypothetical protein